MTILTPLFSQLIRAKRALLSNWWIARALQVAQSQLVFGDSFQHELMVSDSVRLDAYYEAIQRYVTPQDHVLDVGTGTGILAFFAAVKQPRKLYALDHSKKMLEYARRTAQANGITNITFVASSSRSFQPAEMIDVIVQEQMGDMLFHEGMVETIIDVRDRCLKPGGASCRPGSSFFSSRPNSGGVTGFLCSRSSASAASSSGRRPKRRGRRIFIALSSPTRSSTCSASRRRFTPSTSRR